MSEKQQPDWFGNYLRTGLLPDGRRPVDVLIGPVAVHACFDPEVDERRKKGLTIPWPGDGPAPDGYVTPWEHV